MEFSTFSDYAYYAALWLIPLTKTLKFVLGLKAHPQTANGRVVPAHDESSRLDEKIQGEKVFLNEDTKLARVRVVEAHNPQVGCALGSFRGLKKPLIVIAPGLDEVSTPLFFWIYKRSTFLLFSESYLISQITGLIASIIAVGCFGWVCGSSFLAAFFLIVWFLKGIEQLTQFFLDLKADTYATARSSLEELKEARLFLKAELAVSSKTLHPYSFAAWYSKKVLQLRIDKLEQAIGRENLAENRAKSSLLESFLEKNYEEEQKFIEAKKMRVLRWIDADED